jgi:hypothetical protein
MPANRPMRLGTGNAVCPTRVCRRRPTASARASLRLPGAPDTWRCDDVRCHGVCATGDVFMTGAPAERGPWEAAAPGRHAGGARGEPGVGDHRTGVRWVPAGLGTPSRGTPPRGCAPAEDRLCGAAPGRWGRAAGGRVGSAGRAPSRCSPVRLWGVSRGASADRLISALTFASPFRRKDPWSFQCLMVPNGCSTRCLRCCINTGSALRRSCRRSRTCSYTYRVRRRPALCRGHGALS